MSNNIRTLAFAQGGKRDLPGLQVVADALENLEGLPRVGRELPLDLLGVVGVAERGKRGAGEAPIVEAFVPVLDLLALEPLVARRILVGDET